MKRSLVQTGSSLAVTLPVEVVQSFGLQKGQNIDLTVHPVSGSITIRLGVAWFESGKVSAEFRALADEVLERRAGWLKKFGQ